MKPLTRCVHSPASKSKVLIVDLQMMELSLLNSIDLEPPHHEELSTPRSGWLYPVEALDNKSACSASSVQARY